MSPNEGAVHGPGPELLQLIHLAFNAPRVMGMGWDERDEWRDRLVAVRTADELAPADRAILDEAVAEVRAGLSPTLEHPDSWADVGAVGSDWAAEDAVLDAGEPQTKGVDFDEPDDQPAGPAAADLPAADDDGWVGV